MVYLDKQRDVCVFDSSQKEGHYVEPSLDIGEPRPAQPDMGGEILVQKTTFPNFAELCTKPLMSYHDIGRLSPVLFIQLSDAIQGLSGGFS